MHKVALSPVAFLLLLSLAVSTGQTRLPAAGWHLNDAGYYERPGLNVMVFDDFYPEGHQGGVTIIQCGRRVAANGDVRLEPGPGQWSPVPRSGKKEGDA